MKCKYCHEKMITSDGCTFSKVKINGQIFDRIKVGENSDDYYFEKPNSRCGDCGALYGHYHHPGCDIEISPIDGTQLILSAEDFME